MEPKTVSLLVFIAAYVLFVALPTRRAHVSAACALLLVAAGAISPLEALGAVNWNVMGIFVGTLMVADAFMRSRVPAFLAEEIVNRSRSTGWAILAICAMTGAISAFVENVAAVLIVAPIAVSMARKLRLNPVRMIIAIAVSSNLQGAATLIGDPPSMLLGGHAGMDFLDFFFYRGRPSMFFAVEIGAVASFGVLFLIFRRRRERVRLVPVERVLSWAPTGILVALVAALALSPLLDPGFGYMAGAICMAFGIGALLWARAALRQPVGAGIAALDWETAIFLAGIFVIVGGITRAGWVEEIAVALAGLVGGRIFAGYALLVGVSVAASAFVDNVPYLAAMLPVASGMAARLGAPPPLFLFGLLIGASLGGNITPIGASANIVACGILRKEGHAVGFGEFMRVGFPFTLAATVAGAAFVWAVWR
ncbi:MAG: SLC13 family permease [bacterium]|nr:SLC13 family permease [bacterium]